MANWKKAVGWIAIGIGALFLILIVAAALIVRSSAFHNFVLAKAVQQARESTGATVEIKNFDVQLKTLTANVYGITIHGTESAGARPLLQARKLTVGVKITSVLHRQARLSELLVDAPVVNLVVDKNQRTNLPEPPPSNGQKSSVNVFDLAVGHVLLSNGQIYLQDHSIPVNANLFGLQTEINFSQLARKYNGTIEYQSGTIAYPQLKPLPHALQLTFDATPSELDVKPLVVTLGGSHLLLNASVRNFSNAPEANGHYEVLLHTDDFAGLASAKASGDVKLSGTLGFRQDPNQPLLRNATINGTVENSGLSVRTDQAVVQIRKIFGRYELAHGDLRADDVSLNLLGGVLKADATLQRLDSTPRSQVRLKVAGISLAALKGSLRGYRNQQLPVTGTIDAEANANWSGAITNLKASSSIRMRGSLVPSNPQNSQRFPLNADVQVNYDGPRNLIGVQTANIQLPATLITAQGSVGNQSNLVVKATSTDLHQLMLLASSMPSSSQQQQSSAVPKIEGAATLNAVIQGTLQNPRINAQLSATKLQVNQGQFSSLQLAIAANPSQIAVQNGSLVVSPRGQLRFEARVGLQRWSYSASNPIDASLQVQQMPLAMLEQIAMQSYPVSGNLYGSIQLRGSQLDPGGQGRLQITNGKFQDETVKKVSMEFSASGGTIHSVVTERSNKLSLNFTPKTKAYEVKLDVPPQEVSELRTVQAKGLPLKGKLSIKAAGAGTLDDPKIYASIQMDQLQMRTTSISQVKVDLNVAEHLAKVALTSTGGPADLKGNATIKLSPGYYTTASLNTNRIPLDPLLATYYPSRPAGFSGETEVHANIQGPLADKTKLEAHLTIPTFRASYQSLELANTAPIRVDYANSVINLQPSGFKGTDTSLEFQGRVPLAGNEKMKISARGSVSLGLIKMFAPDVRASGAVLLDVSAAGTASQPGVEGQIKIQKASFASDAAPLGVENLNAVLRLSDTGIQITEGTGEVGGGQLKLGGAIVYRPQLQANLSVSTQSVRLRYPDGMRALLDSDLTLTGNSDGSVLQGRVLIDSLSFTSGFDLSTFASQFSGTSAPSTGESALDKLRLQIAVQSSNQLSAGNAEVGIEGQVNLRIVGSAADPVVIGRTDLSSGDIFFRGRQYHIERGLITFANPNVTTPVVNVVISTTVEQYNLTLTFTGPIEKLETTYVSDPPLPPIDIVHLLAFGQTSNEAAPTSLSPSTALAAGLGQIESGVGGAAAKLTGVAGLQIDPLIGGNNTNPSARLGYQKRVSKNFTFTFSTDVTQPQNEIVQGEYQLNKRWSVSVVRNESGGVAVDGRFHTNF